MKNRYSLLLCVLLFSMVWVGIAEAAVSVFFDSGTTNTTNALTGFSTTGDLMAGMDVTAFFADSSSETVTWASLGAPAGKATGTGWFLSELGNTFSADWTLSNSTGQSLTRLLIDAGPGDTVFDTFFGGNFGTPGSGRGKDFTVTSGLGSLDIDATYRDEVALTGFSPVGDLYRYLDIEFTSVGAFASGSSLKYITDTDNILFAGDIAPVPEPLSFCIWGLLAGLGIAIGRRHWLRAA
ncbi:MAG: hypothetical protein ACC628_23175 [Pirellulaceae bacterium]